MIISSELNHETSELIVSYYDELGKVAFAKRPLHQTDLFNWTATGMPTEFRNWDNRFLKKTPSKYLSRFRLEELTQIRFSETELASIYSDFNPRKYFLDIEVKLTNQDFPEPSKALMEVNLISFVNEDNVVFTMSTTEDFDEKTIARLQDEVNDYLKKCNTKFTVKYLFFNNELELLTAFFKNVLPKIPFLTGWNFLGFDWLYLVNRAKRIGLEPMQWMASKVLIGNAKMPIHLGLLDYMEVFMNTKPYKVVENYKLEYIADLVLGVTKLQHEYGSMLEAQSDTFNFAKYNIIDTCLVKLIDDKLGLLDVAFAISKFARVDVSKVFSAVFITETLMCREFLERNRYMANERKDVGEDIKYEGAYVMKPVPGFYKYVELDDFASMYPNLTIQFNMSPDVFLGKIKPGEVIPDNVIFTMNDTLFSNDIDSVARTILIRMYDGRVKTKAEMKILEEKLESEKKSTAA